MKSLPLLSNHPRVRRWTAAVVALAIALGVCLVSYDNVDAAIRQNRIERLNARIENVYTVDYQDMAPWKQPDGPMTLHSTLCRTSTINLKTCFYMVIPISAMDILVVFSR